MGKIRELINTVEEDFEQGVEYVKLSDVEGILDSIESTICDAHGQLDNLNITNLDQVSEAFDILTSLKDDIY